MRRTHENVLAEMPEKVLAYTLLSDRDPFLKETPHSHDDRVFASAFYMERRRERDTRIKGALNILRSRPNKSPS